jgi:hypothetical protein
MNRGHQVSTALTLTSSRSNENRCCPASQLTVINWYLDSSGYRCVLVAWLRNSR